MGDSAALVERMSTAVRTAYKAIEVLKEENKALKAENEELRLQIQSLQGPQQQRVDCESDESTPITSPISTIHPPHVAETSTLIRKPLLAQQAKAKQETTTTSNARQQPLIAIMTKSSAIDTYVPSIVVSSLLVEEYGLSKPSCSTNFGNSPEAKKIIAILKELSMQNVHVLAKSIAPESMETISKAVMFTIHSYITMEVLSAWDTLTSSSSTLGAPAQLLPRNLLAQLDLLGNLFVSLASRAYNGLVRAGKLMGIVKKVILGAIRCQWQSPHYALVLGTERSHHIPAHPSVDSVVHNIDTQSVHANQIENLHLKRRHETVQISGVVSDGDDAEEGSLAGSDGEASEDLDSRGHDGVPDEALSSDSDGNDEEHEALFLQPTERPSLAAWGLASRSTTHNNAGNDPSNNNATGRIGAAVVPQSARKATLSSMFGLDDSSSSSSSSGSEDEEGGDEIKKEKESEDNENDNEEDIFMTNDNDMDVEDADPAIKCENQNKMHTAEAKDIALSVNTVAGHSLSYNTRSGVVEQAGKLYFLLSTLIRLRLVRELVSTLQELRLVTVSNLSVGAIIGIVSVLGSQRYRALGWSGVRTELVALLRQWNNQLLVVMEEHTACGSEKADNSAAMLSIALPTARLLQSLVCSFLSHLEPKQALEPLLKPSNHPTFVRLLLSNDSDDAWGLRGLQNEFRRQGFWGSLILLSSTEAGLSWNELGLNRLPVHAQRVEQMLLSWNPAAMHGSTLTSLSVRDFVTSDDYLFSTLQSVVQGTLKTARIAPGRLIAEDLLVQEFAAHWKDHLTAQSFHSNSSDAAVDFLALSRTVRCVSELLQTFLSTDYDAPEGGWRSGLSGDGFRLSSRLDNRLTVGLALLQKLIENGSVVTHYTAPSMMVMLQPSLQWVHYSSLSSRKTLEYAEFLDHCAHKVFSTGTPSASEVADQREGDQALHTTELKLYTVCCEIAALMALASIEALTFNLVCSLRGLLIAVRGELKMNKNLPGGASHVAKQAISALHKLPSPWAGVSRADIQHELLETTRLLSVIADGSSTISVLREEDLMLRLAVSQPAFVINLDKRTDRYRRLLIMLEQASFTAVRIRAFDGTTTNQASSLTPAEMFQRNFGTQSDPSTADSLLPIARAALRIEDAYDSIPESDVQLTWDSTLNNKFDPRCPVNPRTAATPSERACAASHLRVWRAIAAVCGIKMAKSKLRGLQSLTADVTDAPTESPFTSPEAIYKDLLALKTGGIQLVLSAKPSTSSSSSGKKDAPQNQMSVMEECLQPQEGADYFIVFEDDVSFPQQSLVDLRATVQSIMRVLPRSVDILYLCGVLPKACADFKLRNVKGDPFYSINYAWTLQAYVLRSRAVEVLLSKLPIFAPVDNFVASLVYHGELRACIVKDKLTQRLAGEILPGGGRKNDSDVRASGRSYSGLPKRSVSAPAGEMATEQSVRNNKKRKIDRRKRRKH